MEHHTTAENPHAGPWCHDHKGNAYSYEEFKELARSFHGYPAPGLLVGARMMEEARKRLPEDILFDAISETSSCLPDVVQLLSLCTIGNGWLRIVDLGRYALTLYNKYEGDGIRVAIDPPKLDAWPAYKTWLYKLKHKREQDTPRLFQDIYAAGALVFKVEPVQVQPRFLGKVSKGTVVDCPLCGEAYPVRDGGICKGCLGEAPYAGPARIDSACSWRPSEAEAPGIRVVPVAEAVGEKALHDMTRIVPGESKGVAFKSGQMITSGDICRLQSMGRQYIHVADGEDAPEGFVHENTAALAFAEAMAGEGITYTAPPHEGKINFRAARDGLLKVDTGRLKAFNLAPGVVCASLHAYSTVEKGDEVAGTRAIPLFLPEADFRTAMAVLRGGPLLSVRPFRKAKVGILVTGTELFRGLIQDSFIPIIRAKVEPFGCDVVGTDIVPDDREIIRDGVGKLIDAGADLIVTTAGLSVDPDDVTRHGLLEAGCVDMHYGAPVLPGAMTLLARIGDVQVIGVPACGLYHKTTSFDLLLPRLLAGVEITRNDLAEMAHGAFCKNCETCTFPNCGFGK